MELSIRPLSPGLSRDYFDFFENRAFTDDSPYRCYCQMYQLSKEQYDKLQKENAGNPDYGAVSRKVAEQQIASGALRGYLAFVSGIAVGWCNANDRASYPSDPIYDVPFHSPISNREIAVTCFEISPEYRGRGIAAALLHRVILDAEAEGYAAVVSFPVIRKERYEWDCAGPVRLYENAGFHWVSGQDGILIMRKEL